MRVSTIKRNAHWLIIGVLVLVGAYLRIYQLDWKSMWWDEIVTLTTAKNNFLEIIVRLWRHQSIVFDPAPPFFYLLVHALLSFGKSDFIVRLGSALFGILAIPVFYLLGKDLFNKTVGISAALLLTISAFHLQYSQELRAYSALFFFTLLSFLFFYRALQTQGKKNWISYTITTFFLMYTHYWWVMVVFIQIFFVIISEGLSLVKNRRYRDKFLVAKHNFIAFSICLAALFILYLPWLPSHLEAAAMAKAGGTGPVISWQIASTIFKQLILAHFVGCHLEKYWRLFLYYGGLLGGLVCLISRKRKELFLFLAWLCMPFLILYFSRYNQNLYARYFIILLAPIYLLVSFFGDSVLRNLYRLVYRRDNAGTTPYLLTGVLLIYFTFGSISRFSIPRYYKYENLPNFKKMADFLVDNYRTGDTFLYGSDNSLKTAIDWYLPDWAKKVPNFLKEPYSRIWFLDIYYHTPELYNKDILKDNKLVHLTAFKEVDILKGSLIKTAPLLIAPCENNTWVYKDNYDSFKTLSDAYRSENVQLFSAGRFLFSTDNAKPGFIEYKFVTIDGSRIEKLSIKANVNLLYPADPKEVPKNYVKFFVSSDAKQYELVGSIYFDKQTKYINGGNILNKEFDVAGDIVKGAKELYLKIDLYSDRLTNGAFLDDLELTFTTDKDISPDTNIPLYQLVNMRKLVRFENWEDGIINIDPDNLYVFSCNDKRNAAIPESFWNSEKDLWQFEGKYKDLAPVKVLSYPDGQCAFKIYDPFRASASLRFENNRDYKLKVSGPDPKKLRALIMEGNLNNPVIFVGDQKVKIPVETFLHSKLSIDSKGEGKIIFTSLYSKPDFEPKGTYMEGLALSENEDCISTGNKLKGEIIYRIKSQYPMKKLSLVSQPRIFNDKRRRNYIEASYSADGKHYKRIYRFRSNGNRLYSGIWENKFVSKTKLPLVKGDLFIKFTLVGNGSQLWSNRVHPMVFEIALDTSSFKGLELSSGINVMKVANELDLNIPPENNNLSITSQEEGTITLTPLFSKPDFEPKGAYMEGVVLSEAEDCISNGNNPKGEIVYRMESQYPMKRLLLTSHPRIINDRLRNNYVEAAWSLDGKHYRRIYRFNSNGSDYYSGIFENKFSTETRLPKETKKLLIKFTLVGNGSQLWSNRVHPMVFEIALDTSSFKGIDYNKPIDIELITD